MRADRKPFLPLDPDLVDDRLERLARDKGVGKFERPSADAGGGKGDTATASVPAPVTAADTEDRPSTKLKTLNLELPDYVWTDLKIRAAQQQISLKHVVMKALLKDGIAINDADMIEDGRRLRGSNKR